MFGAGELAALDGQHIRFHRRLQAVAAGQEVFGELRPATGGDAEHVVADQHLGVAVGSGTDADQRDVQRLGQPLARVAAQQPGIGPALAAMRTATEATSRKDDTLWARLDLSNMDKVNPRDQGAVVAWAGLWARKGGERQIVVKTSLTDGGLIDQVVFDPKGTTPAGPHTLTLTELGAPVSVTTPPSTDTTPLK